MKYQVFEIIIIEVVSRYVTALISKNNAISFPAVIGNPNYDQFLLQVELSDEEVKALPTDEWFEV
jgi:hypothetical protein